MWAAYHPMKYEHTAEPATSWLKASDHTEMKLKKIADDKEFKILNTMLRASPSVSQSGVTGQPWNVE